MSTNFNATCPICGAKYNRCSLCSQFKAWKAIADRYEHYQIAMVLTEYREGITDAKQATEHFENIGITSNSDFSVYLEAVARDMKKIIDEGSKQKSKKNKELNEE